YCNLPNSIVIHRRGSVSDRRRFYIFFKILFHGVARRPPVATRPPIARRPPAATRPRYVRQQNSEAVPSGVHLSRKLDGQTLEQAERFKLAESLFEARFLNACRSYELL